MSVDRLGRVLCGSNLGEGLAIAAPAVAGPISTRIIPDRGLVMSMAGTSGTTTASAFFPTGMLASIGRPTGFTPPYAAALDNGGPELVLQNLSRSEEQPYELQLLTRTSLAV